MDEGQAEVIPLSKAASAEWDDIVEISDPEVNVEEIMARIREGITSRKASAELLAPACSNEFPLPNDTERELTGLHAELQQANAAHADIFVDHPITFKTPVIGHLWAAFRRRIHREVRTYLDAMIMRQIKFNAHSVGVMNHSVGVMNHSVGVMSHTAGVMENLVRSTEETRAALEETRAALHRLTSEQAFTSDQISYFSFEDKFRGPSETLRASQAYYVHFFHPGERVLDIGCGRGEFLQLLREKGIGAYGIDLDDDMVAYCHRHHLDVRKEDALDHLRSIPDKSLDGIFASQIIEHLPPAKIVGMLELCHAKLKFGSFLVAETVNALSLFTSAVTFHLDPTHRKPVHPETLKFLLQSLGFASVDLYFSSPVPEEAKLKAVDSDAISDPATRSALELMNKNIEQMNLIIYGHQDYAAIARK